MNLPNKLTIFRVILIPFFVFFLLTDFVPFSRYIALGIFALASLTDLLDGKIARKYNLVTDFGKFMDPLADKMLTTSAYLGFMFIYGGTKYACHIVVITFIVLFREFAVSSIRLVAVTAGGKVVAANMWGKCKTVSQMAGIILALAVYALNEFIILDSGVFAILDTVIIVLFWLSAVLCVISGGIYIWGGRDFIKNAK
jgi:CDP-diacylglycerol--glycerol-3-phosphate 3-phosphatidyltransferase